ncbi:MAG: glucose-1-phosphate thymidylyltransferase RfbA [Deltaproteobacteria bacterium]|jgi:glucose-1-phosphate thymidylyltransferase|nr:glucose-1-phosphate thymidylyltransferase RfbA [Deltaproteobacteria bacterium]
MKGIVLAGGSGSRLDPITRVASKQLQPVYDKPMIYYPLATLMESGIRDILIISTPRDTPLFEQLLGDGHELGVRFSYAIQTEPRGIAEAFIVADRFLDDQPVTLILGDNLFSGFDFAEHIAGFERGALVFGYPVKDPARYGVIELDTDGSVASIVEKPDEPRSNLAVPGLYVYDDTVRARVSTQRPSARGELEITDLNLSYLADGSLRCVAIPRGVAWLDSGTHESLLEAANYIETIEHRQGLKIGCLEEIAYQHGYIDREDLERLIGSMGASGYRSYLEDVVLGG